MKKQKCPLCGYVYEGEDAPKVCPRCHKAVEWTVIEDHEFPEPTLQLKGTQTEKNLRDAFAGESMATNKYQFFARQAQKDGYEQIGAIFAETAKNEQTHAKIWFKYLNGGGISPTAENLADAAAGEHFEHSEMYVRMAKTAREEGFEEIARKFELVGAIEKTHEERYRKLLANLDEGIVFSRDDDRIWVCRECGHIHLGRKAPDACPVCGHPQAFQELKPENY